MKRPKQSKWFPITLDVAFETREMRVLRGGVFREQLTVTPVFRLPDGTRLRGRFSSAALRKALIKAGAPFRKHPKAPE